MHQIIALIVSFIICHVVALGEANFSTLLNQTSTNLTTLNDTLDVAIRTQRDISRPVPLDQLAVTGMSLTNMFLNDDYSSDGISSLRDLLDSGMQAIMVDLYWNEFTSVWQLCPAPFPQNVTHNPTDKVNVTWNNVTYTCQVGFTTDNIMSIIKSYLDASNTDFEANFLHLLFNLKSIHYDKSNLTTSLENIYRPNSHSNIVGNSTLNATISPIASYIFTPQVLQDYRSQILSSSSSYASFYNQSSLDMPTLETVLFSQYKRMLVNVLSDELVPSPRVYSITDTDREYIFFNTTLPTSIRTARDAEPYCQNLLSLNHNLSTYNNLSLATLFDYVVDSGDDQFSPNKVQSFLRCGLLPIFNGTSYKIGDQGVSEVEDLFETFTPYLFWSWRAGEPRLWTNSTKDLSTDDNLDSGASYRCVVLTADGWKVDDCYQKYQIACQNKTEPNDWCIPRDVEQTYFDVNRGHCPDGFNFSLPRSSTEMLALMTAVKNQHAEYPIWIDLNDITIPDCFVSGGPYAQCPYQKTVTTTKFVRMIAPASVVCIIVLIAVLLEKLLRTNHIQSNRKRYWKKALAEYYSKNDYEGVPS
ncbi:MTC6 [Candida theae]|uniref:Maintenance of telomere capping protein 6 n=1 Tax=Candida theae TaxID=1198502 RepID=A0AAD5B8Y7_9ASCO|nr:MTC6 [Candida theae]KAI5948692.1 MTC6 [Candida theae]